nr:RHS repeat-associated core domain-containing protein [Sphingobium sp. SJ10-10]
MSKTPLALVLALSFGNAVVAQTTGATLQWAGQSGGVVAGFATAQQACESNQNTYIPAFGHSVTNLISATPYSDAIINNVAHPTYLCQYNSDQNTVDGIVSVQSCSDGALYAMGACLPPSYVARAEPACDGCSGIPGQFPSVGDPVSLSSGAKVEEVTDYASGGAYPIEIKRYYRSLLMPRDAQSVGFGLAWRTDLIGRKIQTSYPDYNILVSREDGTQTRFLNLNSAADGVDWPACSTQSFTQNGNDYVQCSSGAADEGSDRFRRVSAGIYEYQDEHDRIDTFSSGGLIKTRWKGGYERNYVYAAGDYSYARPIQINDSLGRVVNITWNGNLISAIDLPDGTRLEYTYEARAVDGNVPSASVLTQVVRRKSDGTLIDSRGYQYAASQSGTQVPLLASVTDAAGVAIDTTTYDSIGRVLTAQGPLGANAVSISYDDQATKRTVTNANGQVEVYTFAKAGPVYPGDPNLHLLVMTAIARQQSATVPAASMSLTGNFGSFTKTDWNGIVTPLAYDTQQNETSRTEDVNGLARTTTTTWSNNFRVPTKIVAPNLTVDMTYDTSGRITQRKETDTSVRNGPVRIWNYTYNTLGLLATVTGPRTDVTQTTTYTYDAQGNLATAKDALNRVTTINTVNAAGLPTAITDQNGVVTNMTYDPLGRVTGVTVQGPTPAITTFGYDINGLLTSVTSPTGVVLTYGYDAAHRLTSITDGAGNKTVFALDAMGNRTQMQIQDVSSQVLMANSATFDSLGRLLTSIGAANQTTSYQYDNNGNLTRVTDPRNAVTQNAFDALNRIKQTTDALNAVTQTAYDGRDNVTSITDAKPHATTYTVNGFGFVTQVVSPDNGTTTYTYDLAGNVLSRKDARKIVTNYTWDALDRPLTRTYPSSTTENVTYGYDATTGGNKGVGRLTSLTDAAGTATFAYDAYGNRVAETRTIAGVAYSTSYAYDLAGKLTKITYPSGRIVNYQRDTLGQVSGVTTQANAAAGAVTLASNVTYMPFGPLKAALLGNGVQLTDSYDLDYRLSGRQAVGSATMQNLTLGYDPASNISSITDGVSGSLSQTFQYDLTGRITQGTGVWGTDNYTYDAVGNRLTRSLINGGTTLTTYTYATANTQLTKAVTGSSTLNYAYDANGALLTRKLGNTTQASYTYNADARLSASGTTALKYNAFGERSVETITGGGTHFLFSPDGLLLAEHATAGTLVRNYVYLEGQPLAVIDAAGTISYLLNDQVGQPQKMLNPGGTVSWQRIAGIFGDTVSQPVGTTAANPLRFPGQQYDPNIALHYNYFRDYDPATGRYLETDPIGLYGGVNPYIYVNGNPITQVDPDGKVALNIVTGAIGAIVGGGSNIAAQLYKNGGHFSDIDVSDVIVATAIGGVTGFVAPLAAPGTLGAIGLGGISNVAQSALANWFNGKCTTSDDILISAGTGILGGAVGGGVGYAPNGRTQFIHDVADPAISRGVNEWDRIGNALTRSGVIRNFLGGILGNGQ